MSFLLRTGTYSQLSQSAKRSFSTTRPSRLARLTLVGRLGTDPELNDLSNGSQIIKVASFAPEGPARDYVMGLQKGTLVYLEGDATMKTYEDKSGNKQTSLNLVQTKIEVLKRPTSPEESNNYTVT